MPGKRNMKLTEEQQEMLAGKYGKGASMAMRIQCAVGEGFEAERMVPVSRVHISLSAQNADIWFTEKMTEAGAAARVIPTVNPGYCVKYFREKGWLREEDAVNMRRTEAAYRKLGANMTLSCTPYISDNRPAFGEICAFSETSVTVFANSVLGARTNRESAMSAACAAITGFVPEYGMLLPENRLGTVLVKVSAAVDSVIKFAMLGLCGKKIGRGIPVFAGLPEQIGTESLIALGASLNISGSYDMFHIPGVTPEAPDAETAFGGKAPVRTVELTDRDLDEAFALYSHEPGEAIDYVILGCPHYTWEQVSAAAAFLRGKKACVPIMILTSRTVIAAAAKSGIKEILEEAGADLIPDTCVDEKCCFRCLEGKNGVTDSPKAIYYMENFGIRMAVRDWKTCLAWAVLGKSDSCTPVSGAAKEDHYA